MGVFRFLFVLALIIPVGVVMLFYLRKLIQELAKQPKQTEKPPVAEGKRKKTQAAGRESRIQEEPPRYGTYPSERMGQSVRGLSSAERPPAYEYDRSAYDQYRMKRALQESSREKERGAESRRQSGIRKGTGKSKRQRRKERQNKRREREQ